LRQFSHEYLNYNKPNHLTLEDIPPRSLGGKPIILTCKSCNNTIGHKIDYHLLDRMLEMDISKFLPNCKARPNLEKITLYKCHVSNRRMAFPGIPSIEVSAIYCFEGEHLTLETLVFESALLKISHLDKWVDIGAFENYVINDDELSVKYENPDPIIFFDDSNVKFFAIPKQLADIFAEARLQDNTRHDRIN
jgi:hypothetical protein